MKELGEREESGAKALFSRARALYAAGKEDESATVLGDLLQSHPGHAPGLNLLGLVRLRQEGPTDRVAELFDEAVRSDPSQPVYRNNLGSVRWQQARYESALEQFESVLARDPSNAQAWLNCGNTYRSLGRWPDAERAFVEAASLAPERADIRVNLGGFLHATGRYQEAVECLESALASGLESAECLGNLGLAYGTLGELQRAEDAYRRALEIAPKNASLHGNLGGVLYRRGRLADAIAECRRAILIDQRSAQAYNNLGISLRDAGRVSEAIATLRLALEHEPDSLPAALNLGIALDDEREFAEAAQCFEKVVAADPEWPLALINLGNAYYKLGRPDEARDMLRKAVALAPHPYLASAYSSLGVVLYRQLQWEEALRCFDRAVQETPDYATARFARSMLLLKLGHFEKGWREYEWRFDANRFHYLTSPNWSLPEWNGEPLEGKTLLVYHEQGLGDGIHFVRYLPRLKAMGAKLLMLCGPPLFRLFDSMDVVEEFYSRRDPSSLPEPTFDYHVPLKSLPRIFRTTLDSIPSEVPYLDAPPAAKAAWRARVQSDAFNIGIAWSGNPDQGEDRHRSCEVTDFEPLLSIPGTCFYSLQKGEAASALHEHAGSIGDRIVDFSEELTDFAETAALVQCLDLVITIDTSIAHLAGALARPVWTVLWTAHCWRYLLERTDSPWYPTMRLYRQVQQGDWGPVFEAVARDLRERVRKG